MYNMSYCRFRNTSSDMEECIDAIQQGEHISKDEATWGKAMFRSILVFMRDRDIIADYDGEALEALFE